MPYQYIRSFDKSVAGVVAHLPDSTQGFLKSISIVGGSVFAVIALLVIAIIAITTNNHSLLTVTLLVLVFTPLAEASKFITRRKRPETLYAQSMKFKSYSFPSGHSYVSALMASYITLLAFTYLSAPFSLGISILFIVLSFIVGVSRIYLGAHFPSDVFAGWGFGVLVMFLINILSKVFI